MKCLQCETINSDDSLYCRGCGVRVVPLAGPAREAVPLGTYSVCFANQRAYNQWLQRNANKQVTIVNVSATKQWGLLSGPFNRRQELTVTYTQPMAMHKDDVVRVVAIALVIAAIAIILVFFKTTAPSDTLTGAAAISMFIAVVAGMVAKQRGR